MMKSLNKCIVLCIASVLACVARAQNDVSGVVLSREDKAPVVGAYVMLIEGGTIRDTQVTSGEGGFRFRDVPHGAYAIDVSCIGFENMEDSVAVGTSLQLVYELARSVYDLEEVVVTTDRSQTVSRTANGQKFYLSEAARKTGNPFVALEEIPLIISDASTSTIKMPDGSQPLILIDGMIVNSGVNPIQPSSIESVEVINNVSARYLNMGVSSIVNIRLKKTAGPYVWMEYATRHELPVDKGFAVGYFEVGNTRVSLYGRTSFNYTHDDDMTSATDRYNAGLYRQTYSESLRQDEGKWLGELLLKVRMTAKDYLAAHAYATRGLAKGQGSGLGTYATDTETAYSFTSNSRNEDWVSTYSLYYKHSFAEDDDLEVRLAYNMNADDYEVCRRDLYGTSMYASEAVYKNRRNSGSLYIDYSKAFRSGSSLTAGSATTFQRDEIDRTNAAVPAFLHRNLRQYVYAGYAGRLGTTLYSASVGMEGIWLKAGDKDSRYFRPKASAGITWPMGSHNSLQLGYTLTNTTPPVACLNPYDISVDSLVAETGNPYLKPEVSNRLSLNYTFNRGGLYVTPSVSFTHTSDLVQACGTTDGNVYVSTYENAGHFSRLDVGATASYRLGKVRIYGGVCSGVYCFESQEAKGTVYANAGFSAKMGKFSFYADTYYNSRQYTGTSVTKTGRPATADVQVNYNFTPDFYVAVCLQHFTGQVRDTVVTTDGDFHSTTRRCFTEQAFRPWILVRYTIRRNSDRKIKLGKVLNGNEQGISIRR